MRGIPECLHRRYQALDDLINDLESASLDDSSNYIVDSNDPGIKLMCEFWNILKEDPDLDLTQAVQDRLGVKCKSNSGFKPQRFTCYMAETPNRDDEDDRRDNKNKKLLEKVKSACCSKSSQDKQSKPPSCCSSKGSTSSRTDFLPLSKVLCNLKEAASYHKKCNERIAEVMVTEKGLQEQIKHLEHREKEGVKMLKQADCMWSCMEDAYKQKLAESVERQKAHICQLQEIEQSNAKWRKNMKELEFQLQNINKCEQEMRDKFNQKTNDIKSLDAEIASIQKRIENTKKDTEAAKKTFGPKKQTTDSKIAAMCNNVKNLQNSIKEEHHQKDLKEKEGAKYIKEARNDLTKMCKLLLQKNVEFENIKAEKDSVMEEINMLKQACDKCKDRCKNKQKTVADELKQIDQDIANYKAKCLQCHQCVDTSDIRKFCNDCPRCSEERDCVYKDNHCVHDPTTDCVCMSVKRRFIDNVFENMSTIMARQSKTKTGKAIANSVLECLRISKNGKLDDETRKILQNFTLRSIKRNLNLTIIGGAVKTRCELDADTYKQLMLCLKSIKVTVPSKVSEGTDARKDPCRRWGGTNECNCPRGPKDCICTKKAPPPPNDPTPCPPSNPPPPGEEIICPHMDKSACGPECGMQGGPSGSGIAAWRPDPCKEKTCKFPGSMQATQYVIGSEALTPSRGRIDLSSSNQIVVPHASNKSVKLDVGIPPCSCEPDRRGRPRQRIIEEVMGKYFEVTPIREVPSTVETHDECIGRDYSTKSVEAVAVHVSQISLKHGSSQCSNSAVDLKAVNLQTEVKINKTCHEITFIKPPAAMRKVKFKNQNVDLEESYLNPDNSYRKISNTDNMKFSLLEDASSSRFQMDNEQIVSLRSIETESDIEIKQKAVLNNVMTAIENILVSEETVNDFAKRDQNIEFVTLGSLIEKIEGKISDLEIVGKRNVRIHNH